jgi:hypothetical protein
MDFNNVKAIVDNRMCEPKDTEKEANKLAKHVIEKEENQKTPKKDTLKDMQNLAAAKNQGTAALLKTVQQQKEEGKLETKKPTTKKKTTTKKPAKKETSKNKR